MQRLRASRATTPSRGFITRAASALIFIGATALAFATPGDAAERNTLTPSFSEWRESGSPAPAEENGHWLGADVGTFRINRGDGLHDRIFRAVQSRVHQEPEKAAREVHSLVVGDAAGREKLRQMLLNAAEGKEMMTALDLDSWWQSYTDSYLLDLADAGVNEVLQYSEERMLARLGFVKNVNLEYRTPLGGRTGYGALSFLGALSEKEDSVVAWQLRASHNEDAESGLNAGLIFRHARDKYAEGDLFAGHPMLLGLNAFLDFETHEAGNFLRYSIGGEIRTGALDFYGNYYIPLSDTKIKGDYAYYSAEGFDVEANVGVPGADWLSGVVGYYWWEGEGTLEDEEGTKFGFRARPNTSWEFEFEYDLADEGDQEIGGRLSYTRQIGDQPSFNVSSRPFGGNFNPRNHFYDVVRRQYAQRIRSYLAGPSNPVIIPMASTIPGMVEFSGVVTLASADVTLETTYPIVGASTVNVSGGDAIIGLGFGSDVLAGTVGLEAGGEYVFDTNAQAIIVRSGGVYWDDPSAGWARNIGDDGGSTVMLYGTGFTVDVASNAISDFVLYEGKGDAHAVGDPDPMSAGVKMDCSQGSSTSATAAEGRFRTGTYTTECYGDLATDGTGANLAIGDTPLEAEKDYPNPVEAMLVASGAAALVMRGGRGDTENVDISFTGANSVDILNDVAGGIRYVKGGNFSINGQNIACTFDGANDIILSYVGGVAGYCPEALTDYQNRQIPLVGIASGFAAPNAALTMRVPFNVPGVDVSFTLVSGPNGVAVASDGVISVNDRSDLTDGGNAVIIQQNFSAGIPGVNLDESLDLAVTLHQLAPNGKAIVVLVDQAPEDAFPGGNNQVTGDNMGFSFTGDLNGIIVGADDSALSGSGISYDSGTNMFSIANSLTLTATYTIAVTVDADNIRGMHSMNVEVRVVDQVVITPEYLVSGADQNIAVLANYTGGELSENLKPMTSGAGLRCSIASGNGFTVAPDCSSLRLNAPLASGSSEVVVNVEHTVDKDLETLLLVPYSGKYPDANQTSIDPVTVPVKIIVWSTPGAASPQTDSATSGKPLSGVAFAPPTNVGGIDFSTGRWNPTKEEGDLVVDTDGSISGTPADTDEEEYSLEFVADFSHDMLNDGTVPQSGVVFNLSVTDTPPVPATVMFSAGENGIIAVRVGNKVIPQNGAVTVGSDVVDIIFEAVPNAGFRVDSWTDLGDPACGSESGGHGGAKLCIVRALNDADYNVSVSFVAGALPADIPESGDVPARNVAGVLSCMALGGRFVPAITNDTCQDFAGAGSSCVIEGNNGANCQSVFNSVRDCNEMNLTVAFDASSTSATCPTSGSGAVTACSSGQQAIGGECAPANVGPFQVSFSPADKVEAFRLDGTPVAGYVSDNVVLSVVATPASGSFVAGWSDNCEVPVGKSTYDHDGNRRTPGVLAIQGDTPGGGFDDSDAKFCFVRITMNTNVSADIQVKPGGAPVYPIFGTDLAAGETLADNEANCELYGGTYVGASDECTELDDAGGKCLHFNPLTNIPTCGPNFDTMRNCLNINKPVELLRPDSSSPTGIEAVCKDACPTGQRAQGKSCVPAASFIDNRVSYSPVIDDGGPLSGAASGTPPDIASKKKEKSGLSGEADNARFVGGGGRFGFPSMLLGAFPSQFADELPPGIEKSGDVLVNQANCEAFLGSFDPSAPGFCIGIGNTVLLPFCEVGKDCQAQFNGVRDCNAANLRGGAPVITDLGSCGDPCPEGLTALGQFCVYEKGGVVQEARVEGELPKGMVTVGNVPVNQANCEAFMGDFDPSAPGFCIGIGNSVLLPFCEVGKDCQAQFNGVRDCNLANLRGGAPVITDLGSCGDPCEYGRVARGVQCVAPTAIDGIEIDNPGEGGSLASTGGLTVGSNPDAVDGTTYVLTATPQDGYHVSEWTGACGAGGLHQAQASPYRSNPRTCSVTKVADAGLEVGVVFKRGLLAAAVPVTGSIAVAASDGICEGFGGTQQVTLGASDEVTYCDGFNQSDSREAEDENIEDQCWIAGGFIGTDDTDDSFDGNIQRCSSAFVVARECNKLNMRSISILPGPAPTGAECDATEDATCAPQAFARGVGNQAASGLCGESCGDNEIAQGGNCITATAAASASRE